MLWGTVEGPSWFPMVDADGSGKLGSSSSLEVGTGGRRFELRSGLLIITQSRQKRRNALGG